VVSCGIINTEYMYIKNNTVNIYVNVTKYNFYRRAVSLPLEYGLYNSLFRVMKDVCE